MRARRLGARCCLANPPISGSVAAAAAAPPVVTVGSSSARIWVWVVSIGAVIPGLVSEGCLLQSTKIGLKAWYMAWRTP